MNYKNQKVMKLSNENQMMFNIVPLFGAPKKQKPTFGRLFRFYSLSISGNGLAKTFGNGVSNSMSFFLMGWWKQSL